MAARRTLKAVPSRRELEDDPFGDRATLKCRECRGLFQRPPDLEAWIAASRCPHCERQRSEARAVTAVAIKRMKEPVEVIRSPLLEDCEEAEVRLTREIV